jgi:hypothetical protein
MWPEGVLPNLICYYSIYMEGLSEITNNVSNVNRSRT